MSLGKVRFKRRNRPRPGLVSAALLFAVICAALVLLAAPPSCDVTPTLSPEQVTAAKVRGALEHTRRANQALERKDYGRAREHVRSAREALTDAVMRLAPAPDND